uniref:non-specific serine/threonine protein kinase n=1 Tax=Araucaria cunninghamii TaxID=56994 RepID=A0A0D6R7B4_ARACU
MKPFLADWELVRVVMMKCFYGNTKKDEPSSQRKKSFSSFSDHDQRTNSERIPDDVSVEPSPSIVKVSSQKPINLREFTFSELRSATRNFSRNLMLGEGGFGCVYRGYIKNLNDPPTRTEVAVKRLNNKGLQGHKEWVTEVHFLGLVDHPNLVKLVGYCAEDDERGIQRLLVYEFMPNKSLEDHLFSRALPVLPWSLRLKIALGAALGLANLHEELDVQIIFRDFKSSNILLDENFNPKLSDFGLARQGPTGGISHVSTAVVGTAGYAAPEYVQTGHLTSKSDVWSFGVVLYELLTGRRSMDKNRPKNEQKLLEWVKPYLSESKKFRLILDPRLEGKYSLREAQKIAYLAHKCLVKQPKARPKMSEVVRDLKRIIQTSGPGSPQASVLSPSTERDATNLSKEHIKVSGNAKKHFLLLRDMINLRSRENGCSARRAWMPKTVRQS